MLDVICIHLTLNCTIDDGFGPLKLFFSDDLVTLVLSIAYALRCNPKRHDDVKQSGDGLLQKAPTGKSFKPSSSKRTF